MSAYEELVERCAKACRKRQLERTFTGRAFDPDVPATEPELDNARAIIAEVARTLENVTPEMKRSGDHRFCQDWPSADDDEEECREVIRQSWRDEYAAIFRTMLRVSPIFPPDKEPPQ